MPDPTWPSSPPEANYLRLAGPGAAGTATTLASGAAWQALMASHQAAFTASSLNTTATALNFSGVGGTSSAATATGLNTALQLLAGWVQEKPPIATSAVAAYELAVSAMIPAEIAAANRAEQAADVALNPLVFGALTPAIVALDTVYFGEFWPQNAASGVAYGAALGALVAALAVPPPLSPPGASPAAPAAAAAAVAESVGQTAASEALKESSNAADYAGDGASAPGAAVSQVGQMASMLSQPIQSLSGAAQPLSGMFTAPMQALQALAGFPQSMPTSIAQPLGDNASGAEGWIGGAFPAAGVPAAGAVTGAGSGSSVGSLGGGPGAGAVGNPAGAGLTSFSRPAGSFGTDNAGRPSGLKAGPLSAADLRPAGAISGSPLPVGPGQQALAKGVNDREEISYARVITPAAAAAGKPDS